MKKRVFCLYGIDQNGVPVCMFFEKKSHLRDFRNSLPGTYNVMTLKGIGYADFEVKS